MIHTQVCLRLKSAHFPHSDYNPSSVLESEGLTWNVLYIRFASFHPSLFICLVQEARGCVPRHRVNRLLPQRWAPRGLTLSSYKQGRPGENPSVKLRRPSLIEQLHYTGSRALVGFLMEPAVWRRCQGCGDEGPGQRKALAMPGIISHRFRDL